MMYFSAKTLYVPIYFLALTLFIDGVLSNEKWDLLNHDQCGISYSNRIVGGKSARLGQYPWIARIGYSYEQNANFVVYMCGGTLISSMYVLTAAHCIANIPAPLNISNIRLGEHDVNTEEDCGNGHCAPPVQDIKPAAIRYHTNFGTPQYRHDIGLVRLSRPANLNEFVMPACLPTPKMLGIDSVGVMAEVAGWGISDIETEYQNPVLQHVTVPVVPLVECVLAYISHTRLGDEQLCAGGLKGEDSCSGDSGGPLTTVADNEESPRHYLIGLVSFGARKCGLPIPAVYTKISKYMDWILDNVEP